MPSYFLRLFLECQVISKYKLLEDELVPMDESVSSPFFKIDCAPLKLSLLEIAKGFVNQLVTALGEYHRKLNTKYVM